MTSQEGSAPLYPSTFPIKVIGDNNRALEEIIIQTMSSLGEVVHPGEMETKLSKDEKYRSITFAIVARSREHVEQIYSELNARKEVKIVL